MAKIDQDLAQPGLTPDTGKARLRKLKRQSGAENLNSAAELRADKRRPEGNKGPTRRERMVSRKVSSQASGASTYKRRKPDSKASESLFEATVRAETQRIRKPDNNIQFNKNRRVFEAHSESAPPVMVRGGVGGMAFGRVATSKASKRKAPKRRIDVALHEPGAEVRLPAIPLLHLGWRGISLLLVLMMLVSLFMMWKAPIFRIETIETKGMQRLTKSDLNAVMGALGKSVFTINPVAVKRTLSQAFPEFSKISVKVGLPASVAVVVNEREPIIDWLQEGSETWVDSEGVSFPVRGTISGTLIKVEAHGTPPTVALSSSGDGVGATPDGLLMPGSPITSTLRLSTELVDSIRALSAKMPVDTVLAYDSERGLGWKDPKGWEVYFGSEDQDTEMKLAVYQALVQRLESEGIQPALISVEYVHAPYYRMER